MYCSKHVRILEVWTLRAALNSDPHNFGSARYTNSLVVLPGILYQCSAWSALFVQAENTASVCMSALIPWYGPQSQAASVVNPIPSDEKQKLIKTCHFCFLANSRACVILICIKLYCGIVFGRAIIIVDLKHCWTPTRRGNKAIVMHLISGLSANARRNDGTPPTKRLCAVA